MSNFIKIRPVGAALFCEDGRADIAVIITASRNFPNAPKNYAVCSHITHLCFFFKISETTTCAASADSFYNLDGVCELGKVRLG